ncbi:cysteine desulfurase family protein [Clostridium folliculivorans]|uniref:cysteine desulfurase family protein n=1 Tax=Clostridium folliculivorans TaxID=2886038 RepID=UPI0021C4BE72|nr:cysteine desulfurase family protein [Clostridium folliculivorans]GKU30194.1 cysteine desulfurase IscS [Clostridium folliculivorans]
MSDKIYLDYAATTFIRPEVITEINPYLSEFYANPSSLYFDGRQNKIAINRARKNVAELIKCNKNEVFFTSGGSESNNWALKGIAFANKSKGKKIVTSAIEHHSILTACDFLSKNGFEIVYLPVNSQGRVDLNFLENCVSKDTLVVSINYANNEIGTIQPMKEIAEICKKNNVYFHTDAVQAVGHIDIDVKNIGIDLLSMSSHKIYGPKGCGALFIRDGVILDNLIHGGKQESFRRAGTENVTGIVGFGKAALLSNIELQTEKIRLYELKEYFLDKLLNENPNIILNNPDKFNTLHNNINISIPGIDSHEMLLKLENRNIYVSAGSACTAGNITGSHVLSAIGLAEDLAKSAIRISLGLLTTKNELDYVVEVIGQIIN